MRVISIFMVLVLMCSFGFAASGVSPASYDIDFEPGYRGEFVFDFLVEDGSADLYVEGDLAKYVTLNEDEISGRVRVVAVLNLPQVIDSPGVNLVRVGTEDVGGFIRINVPYPERYVEVSLNAPNANVGEDVLFRLGLFGKGVESVVVSPRVEVFLEGESVEVINLDNVEVFPGGEVDVNFSLDTSSYSARNYLAVAFLDYDDRIVSVENSFRLGEFSVGLVNYTKYFRENKIERFEILVENLWNDNINEVYGEVRVLGFDSVGFVTSSEGLSAWGNQMLIGFLDTTEIKGGSFEVEIILHYGNKTVSEIVELEVIEGFDYIFWIMVIVVILVLVFLFWRSLVFVEKFNKHKKRKG